VAEASADGCAAVEETTGGPAARASSAPATAPPTKFDRDTAVWRTPDGAGERDAHTEDGERLAAGERAVFGAEVAGDWRAGRGPHGGYLAAMLLRALMASVPDPARAPRSLTIHYARAPEPGPVRITTTLEREGRSLSTLSARMHQGGELIALVLSAFSLPWSGPEISEVRMPQVAPADPSREGLKLMEHGPEFARHIVLQPRFEGRPLSGVEHPMLIRAWMGLAEPRAVDALALAFFSDALIPAPYMRMREFSAVPTIDLTVHFRDRIGPAPAAARPPQGDSRPGGPPRGEHPPQADPHELVLAQTTSELVHDGFFVEDGLIWAADGTLLAHSRQLAIVVPFRASA